MKIRHPKTMCKQNSNYSDPEYEEACKLGRKIRKMVREEVLAALYEYEALKQRPQEQFPYSPPSEPQQKQTG
jgi:hypothetical protein